MIKAYSSIFKLNILKDLQYKSKLFILMFMNMFFGIMQVAIFYTFYKLGNSSSISHSLNEGISYIWITQITFVLDPVYYDYDIRNGFRSGNILYEMLRPLDLYNHWMLRNISRKIVPLAFRSLPLLIIVAFLPEPFNLILPSNINTLIFFVFSMFLSLILNATISNLICMTYLNVEMGVGLSTLVQNAILLFNGREIPLFIYPDWLEKVLNILPFASMNDSTINIYLGVISGSGVYIVFIKQILWAIFFMLLGRLILKKHQKKLVIQGGSCE